MRKGKSTTRRPRSSAEREWSRAARGRSLRRRAPDPAGWMRMEGPCCLRRHAYGGGRRDGKSDRGTQGAHRGGNCQVRGQADKGPTDDPGRDLRSGSTTRTTNRCSPSETTTSSRRPADEDDGAWSLERRSVRDGRRRASVCRHRHRRGDTTDPVSAGQGCRTATRPDRRGFLHSDCPVSTSHPFTVMM